MHFCILLLLSVLKKLIAMDVELDKQSMWLLIDKVVKPEEHQSNFVFSSLQPILKAVDISIGELYKRLKDQHIEASPKLLMTIRRERKMKNLRTKLQSQRVSRPRSCPGWSLVRLRCTALTMTLSLSSSLTVRPSRLL